MRVAIDRGPAALTVADMNQRPVQPVNDGDDRSDVASFIARYRPRNSGPQLSAALPKMRELIAASQPISVVDARVMFSALGRFLADVAGDGPMDVDVLLTETEVSRWGHAVLRSGGHERSLSNDLGRLRRLLRVTANLPARMDRPTGGRRIGRGLSATARARLESELEQAPRGVAAAYVAAVGAGVIGQARCGRLETRGGRPFVVTSDGDLDVVPALRAFAVRLDGTAIGSSDWRALRCFARALGIDMNSRITAVTHLRLALDEPTSYADLARRHWRLTQMTERDLEDLEFPPDDVVRRMLRG